MKRISLAIVFGIIISEYSFSQGCSDAGFCTIDGIHASSEDNHSKTDTVNEKQILHNSLKTGISFGNTRYSVSIITPYAEYSRFISKKWSGSLKILGNFRFGELTTVAGFSDALLSFKYAVDRNHNIIGGIKVPFSYGNKKFQGMDMPMAYQISLGTYDIIAGYSLNIKNWILVFAYQQPIKQNKNHFLSSEFTAVKFSPEYPNTRNYQRSGDILLRATYAHYLKTKSRKWKLIYSVLPIYHLQNDKYSDIENQWQMISGSKGLTLNANFLVNYKLNPTTNIEFSAGLPVIARTVRPDGLQQFAIIAELIKKF